MGYSGPKFNVRVLIRDKRGDTDTEEKPCEDEAEMGGRQAQAWRPLDHPLPPPPPPPVAGRGGRTLPWSL